VLRALVNGDLRLRDAYKNRTSLGAAAAEAPQLVTQPESRPDLGPQQEKLPAVVTIPSLLTPAEVCAYLRIPLETLYTRMPFRYVQVGSEHNVLFFADAIALAPSEPPFATRANRPTERGRDRAHRRLSR
jgi:hypothetical protein